MIPILVFVASEAVNKNYDTVFSAAQGFLTNTWCVDSSQIKKKKTIIIILHLSNRILQVHSFLHLKILNLTLGTFWWMFSYQQIFWPFHK